MEHMDQSFELRAKVAKVDESLGLVFGWAIVCTKNGEDYYDTQGDHIPEDSMLEAATDFAKSARAAKVQHEGDDVGTVVHTFPMTDDIAKAFGIATTTTGLMIAMQPEEDVLQKFRDGELTGFSIGGERIKDEVVEA